MTSSQQPQRPGWPEILAAAVAFAAIFALTYVILHAIPEEQATATGLVGLAMSAILGLGAFAAAVLIRIRRLAPFGIKRTSGKWLLAGAGIGAVCYVLGIFVSGLYTVISGDNQNIQTSYQSAAAGGVVSLLASLVLGSVATPIGEEFLWRGVVTNMLGRYGAWVSVLVSAAVFAVAHGINPVMPVAFVVGVSAALLFRHTGSVWPGVFVHAVNNAVALLVPVVVGLVIS